VIDERWWPAIGLVALMGLVPAIVCVGLRQDDDDGRSRSVAPRERRADDDEATPDPEPAPEEGGGEPEDDTPLEGTRAVSGVVTLDEVPIAGVEVLHESASRFDETDDEGRFELASVPAHEVVLVLSAPGYRRERVTLEPGLEDAVVELEIEPGRAPAGVVTDPLGKALRAAEVRCIDGDDVEPATSDAWGRFELDDAATGCEAAASHPDFASSAPRTLAAGPSNRFTLAAPGAITGTVSDEQGHARRTFVVEIARFVDRSGAAQEKRYRQTFSHPQGRFTMSRLEEGRYVLAISVRGREAVETRPIEVRAGARPTPVAVTLP
jgi:hypothetical protein